MSSSKIKLDQFDAQIRLPPTVKTFLICAIAMAFPLGGAGFELGAYGELFYSRKITAWSTVTAALVALSVIPRRITGVKIWQLCVLAIPSVWAVLAQILGSHTGGQITRPVLFTLATLSYVFCLPYAIYLVVQIINPDLLKISSWKPRMAVIGIGILFVLLGYVGGRNNDWFMTCEKFEIAGDTPPASCRHLE
jgi:hypothetical protein